MLKMEKTALLERINEILASANQEDFEELLEISEKFCKDRKSIGYNDGSYGQLLNLAYYLLEHFQDTEDKRFYTAGNELQKVLILECPRLMRQKGYVEVIEETEPMDFGKEKPEHDKQEIEI
jgi:hypothetical protein